MKKTTNNKVIYSLSLILMLAMTFLMVLTQSSLAQIGVPQPEETSGFISVAPTLIGVDQTATVNLWVFPMPATYLYTPYFGGFTDITVTFVKPNGSEDTFMPVSGGGQFEPGRTEANGAIFFYYAPDTAGDWSVSFTMPEQNITDSAGTVIYQACTSNTFDFTVTEEEQLAGLLNGYPWAELPNENTYWDYPLSSNNREWNQISGEWLQGRAGAYVRNNYFTGVTSNCWQPYGPGPNTGHIVWSQPLRGAGIIGGDYGSLSYYFPDYSGSVIIEGHLFRTDRRGGYANANFECLDLATGEVIYTAPGDISCGIHLPGNPYSQSIFDPSVVLASSFGNYVTPYLFGVSGTNWNYYNPFNGELARSISNASRGFKLVDGTNLAFGTASGNLTAWDISKLGRSNDWPIGIIWTRELPASNTGRAPSLFAISTDISTIVLSTRNQYWGYSAEDGTSLWNLNLTYAVQSDEQFSLYGVDNFIVFDPVAVTFKCYSMLNGHLLWTSPSYKSSPWASSWAVFESYTNDLDNVYIQLPDGTVTALRIETGQEVWRSEPIPSTEYTNNVVPFWQGMIMVGGNIYSYAGYSMGYSIDPIPRHAMLVCIDTTTGDIKYTLNGAVFPEAAANGYVIGSSIFDGNIYCIGKGPTSTSVIIQDDVVAKGDTVHIKGNVLDQSPAAQEYNSQVVFPNGVPAVSDEDMSEWMDYLYMQNSTLLNNPPTPDGIPVNLYVVKPDGTEEWITTVTSDSLGNYEHPYVPPTEGVYKVIAKFEGSESYWPSIAGTSFVATPAAAAGGPIEPEEPTTPPPTEEPTTAPPTEEPTTEVPTTEEPTTTPPTEEPSAEAPFPTTEVIIVAAVAVAAVIGIGAYWILRRR